MIRSGIEKSISAFLKKYVVQKPSPVLRISKSPVDTDSSKLVTETAFRFESIYVTERQERRRLSTVSSTDVPFGMRGVLYQTKPFSLSFTEKSEVSRSTASERRLFSAIIVQPSAFVSVCSAAPQGKKQKLITAAQKRIIILFFIFQDLLTVKNFPVKA